MGYPAQNPTPPRDLQVLLYVVQQGKKDAFFQYYQQTIIPYLKGEGVEDAVVWTFEYNNRTLFAIATSPTIPPWFGVDQLIRLEDYVEKLPESMFVNRPDMHIHADLSATVLGQKV